MSISFALLLLVVLPLLAGCSLALLRRRHQRVENRLSEARNLERSADHVLEVAQTIHTHTGRDDVAHALLSLVDRFIERAAALAPDGVRNRQLLERCRALEQLLRTQASDERDPAPTAAEEQELNRTRFLLVEATRLLSRLQKERLFDEAELRSMLHVLHQTQRAVDLRLQLRAAISGLAARGDINLSTRNQASS